MHGSAWQCLPVKKFHSTGVLLMNSFSKQYRIPLFCLVTLLYWASLYTYVPVLTPYIESLGATHKMAGLIVGSYGFVQMLLRIPTGIISDKFHKRRFFISLGLAFSLFSAGGMLLFKELTIILLLRGLAGVAAATWVDFTILFSSYYKREETAKAIGTIMFYSTLGQTLAMFAGSYAADLTGFDATFIMGIFLAVTGVFLSLFLIEKNNPEVKPPALKDIISVSTNKTLITVSLLAVLSQLVTFSTVFGFTPLFANETLHISRFEMGLLTVFSSLPAAFSSLLAGRFLTKYFNEKSLIIGGFLLTGIFTISVPFTQSLWLLLLTQVVAGIGRGLSFPMLMGLSIKDIPQNKRATSMGFFQAIYGLGMFIGPVTMGFLGDLFSLRAGFIFVGAIAILTALLAKMFIHRV